MGLNLPKNLPLIEKVARMLNSSSLDNVYLFGVQHLAYTTTEMFKALIQNGFPAKNIFLHGKCYSTNPYAVGTLKNLGVCVAPQSSNFNSHIEYDKQFPGFVKDFFSPLMTKFKGKKIILDDGAELLKLAMELAQDNEIVAIEQTSAGYHRAKSQAFFFPIINVARAGTKLTQESSFITRMISRKIKEAIDLFKSTTNSKILVIGGGAIGHGVYSLLKAEYSTDIFDLNASLSDFSKEEFDQKLSQYDAIIGCTGSCSIPKEKHSLIKSGALLISASSSDREFDGIALRRKVPIYYDCHKTIVSEGLVLVNSGFPVNFDKTFLDSTEFQLTRALLLMAIHQAIEMSPRQESGFVALKNTDFLSKEYKKLISSGEISKENSEIEFRFQDSVSL